MITIAISPRLKPYRTLTGGVEAYYLVRQLMQAYNPVRVK